LNRCGENNSNWRGGVSRSHGYTIVFMPEHPRRDPSGYVFQHILTAEKALRKPLPIKAVVHHANGSRNSGPIVICQDHAYHMLLHQRMRALKACGHANWLRCPHCKQYDPPEKMYVRPDGTSGHHRECHTDYKRTHYIAGSRAKEINNSAGAKLAKSDESDSEE